MRQIYLAAPIVGISDEWKEKINNVKKGMLEGNYLEPYFPDENGVPNAWGMSMQEWSRCIFTMDVLAIDKSDWVVVCDFGRQMTAGTAWEAGYAFGKSKKVLVIRMNGNTDYSVMINGCSSNAVTYEDFMKEPIVSHYLYEKARVVKDDVTFNQED